MVCHNLEELEVKDIEACGVILRNLYLFEERLTEDCNWDCVDSLEQLDEVAKHEFSYVNFPVKLDQNKS